MNQPTLYILMRRDMDSMNAGKAMAQAAHAANQFTYKIENLSDVTEWYGEAYTGEDRREPAGFGTTLTLGIWSEREMREVVDGAREEGFIADVVLDNTYPVRDGKVTHLIPVYTCAYVFTECRTETPVSSLAGLDLHP
jgi:peptidyl-tRNA hydrolase